MDWHWSTWYWLVLIVLGVGGMELYAAITGKAKTLSRFIWDRFAIGKRGEGKKYRRLRFVILLGFGLTLLGHLVFELPFFPWLAIFVVGFAWVLVYSITQDKREGQAMKTPAQEKWDRMRQQTWNGLPKHLDHVARQKEADRLMKKHHGRRPKGMPLWLRLGAWVAGEGASMKRLWSWFDGKKTLISSILVGAPLIVDELATIAGVAGLPDSRIAAVVGLVGLAVGWGHKFMKFMRLAKAR